MQTIRNAMNKFSFGQAIAAVVLATVIITLIPTVGIAIIYRWKAPARESKSPSVADKPIEFDSRVWQPGENLHSTGDVSRPSMIARAYYCGSADERLVEFSPRPNSGEAVFKRMLIPQVKRDGRWITHGRTADWDLDGSRSEIDYFEGEIHGTQRVWHPNGKLHIERQFAFGKENGLERAWHPNGRPMYEVINVDGREVSGKSWDENGNPR